MIRLFGTRPGGLLLAVAGMCVLVIGVVVHGLVLMAVGVVLTVRAAAMLVISSRRAR